MHPIDCSWGDESELSDLDSEDDYSVQLQNTHCTEFLARVAKMVPDGRLKLVKSRIGSCVDCEDAGTRQFCRFQGLRRVTIDNVDVKVDLMGGRFTQYEDISGQESDFYYDLLFYPRLNMEYIAYLREYIAPILLSSVLNEMEILQAHGDVPLVPQSKSPNYVEKCDDCLWTFAFLSWICDGCGRQYCIKCRREKAPCGCGSPSTLLSSTMSPVSLRALALKLEETQPSSSADLIRSKPASASRHITILTGEWSTAEFLATWSQGRPLVVRNHAGLQLDWSPKSLARFLGDDPCEIVDCEDPSYTHRTTVRQFFEEEMDGKGTRSRVLKLKDYPTEATFKEKCPRLARDFCLALPVPEFTSDEGCLNIANYFPSNYRCSPDIGPKIYAAMGTIQDNNHHGSTRLHMDMADAVNIMASDGKARWDIFIPEDSQKIRDFIRSNRLEDDGDDPIHAQNIYLRESDLEELRLINVVPFTFEQSQGDCVFIPAGCAHQVSNITACIKIAADFVSPHSLSRCAQIAEELQACNTAFDCLEFANLMIHAWMALHSLEARCLNEDSIRIPRSVNPPPLEDLEDCSRGRSGEHMHDHDTSQDDPDIDVRLEQEPRLVSMRMDPDLLPTMAPISGGDVTQQTVTDINNSKGGTGTGAGHDHDMDLWRLDLDTDMEQGWRRVGVSPRPPPATPPDPDPDPAPVLPASATVIHETRPVPAHEHTHHAHGHQPLYRMASEPRYVVADFAQPQYNGHMHDILHNQPGANYNNTMAAANQDDIQKASKLIFQIGLTRVVEAMSRQGDHMSGGNPSQHATTSNVNVTHGQLQQFPMVATTAAGQLQRAMTIGHSTAALGTSRSGSLAFGPSNSRSSNSCMQLPGTSHVYSHPAAASGSGATRMPPLMSVFSASSREDYFRYKPERTCSTCHRGESVCRGVIRRHYCPQWTDEIPPPRKKRRTNN